MIHFASLYFPPGYRSTGRVTATKPPLPQRTGAPQLRSANSGAWCRWSCVQPGAERIACNQVEWHGAFLVAFAGAYEHGSAALVQNDIAHIAQCGFFDAQSCLEHECDRCPVADRGLVFEGCDDAACVLFERMHQAVIFVVGEAAMFGGWDPALFFFDALHEFDAKRAVRGLDPHAQDAERPVA